MVAAGASSEQGASGQSDMALVAAAQLDHHAFAALYERYVDRVYGYCARRLSSSELAADATSQVFLNALIGLNAFSPATPSSFRSWLFAIAHNVCVDSQRQFRDHTDIDAVRDSEALIDRLPGPDESAQCAEGEREVHRLLESLTPDQQRVVELRLAGLTGQEVADALGLSLSAVKASQFRAYSRLRRILAFDERKRTEICDGRQ